MKLSADQEFKLLIDEAGLKYETEYRFHDSRKWRFDFAFPDVKLAVEIEGVTHYGRNANGTMKLGRHQTSKGYSNDCEKYNAAAMLGWSVLRYTQRMVRRGVAIEQVRKVYESKSRAIG